MQDKYKYVVIYNKLYKKNHNDKDLFDVCNKYKQVETIELSKAIKRYSEKQIKSWLNSVATTNSIYTNKYINYNKYNNTKYLIKSYILIVFDDKNEVEWVAQHKKTIKTYIELFGTEK